MGLQSIIKRYDEAAGTFTIDVHASLHTDANVLCCCIYAATGAGGGGGEGGRHAHDRLAHTTVEGG